jgi:glycosyltransferase involved in cell wall biosynthesis
LKVLIFTQYYLPEPPPGAYRLASLAQTLKKRGHEVEVLTAWPNYPQFKVTEGYKQSFYGLEEMNGIRVHRSWAILLGKKGIFSRLLLFISFQFSSIINGLSKVNKPDLIICLSPPIINGFAGMILKKFHGAKLVLNIADLWPESGVKLGLIKNRLLIKMLVKLEEKLYQEADGIACQTNGIVSNISARFPDKKMIWFRNGVDFEFYSNSIIDEKIINEIKPQLKGFVVCYSGLIGHAQGLDVLVKAAKILQGKVNVSYLIVGDGPLKPEMVNNVTAEGLTNFIFTGSQPKKLMSSFLSLADVCLVPLIKSDLFLGAIPSKIFDCFAVCKTILLGVDGEARELFCNQYDCAYFYEPGDAVELANSIVKTINEKEKLVEKGEFAYKIMEQEFNRTNINEGIVDFLESIN